MVYSMVMEDFPIHRTFSALKHVRRQEAAFERECSCTRRIMHRYAQRHRSMKRIVLLDGSRFRWEGLGNSATRWMGLLRWGHATGRAAFLKISGECAHHERKAPARSSSPACHLDPGSYFTGWGGVDWQWRGRRGAAMRRTMEARGIAETVLVYTCEPHYRRANGCTRPTLRFGNGSSVTLTEPDELLAWFQQLREPWVTVRLAQQNSLEASYSRPEALRGWGKLWKCPLPHGVDWNSREAALKCETFAYMQVSANV